MNMKQRKDSGLLSPQVFMESNHVGRTRWLWAFAMTFVMMLGSPEVFGQQQVFDLNAESNRSGSTILQRWSNWVKTYTSSPNVTYWKGENAWTGWNCWHNNGNQETGENAGRPTTWWSGSWINPVNDVNYGERCEFWYHFKYENINEITPDHPYIEIWTPCYDNDDSSTSDIVKASALYVTNAQGRDVLVAVQQQAYRQLDNYRYNYNSSGSVLKNSVSTNANQMNGWYNSYSGTVSPGILINWSKASENRYFDGSGPERAKLRYYPGWNMGETIDLSFILNWDMNTDNNNYQSSYSCPRYVSKGWTKNSNQNNFYWSVDWPNMYVTKGIKVTNHVNAPTVTRQRNGKLGVSASGVTTYDDFVTDFVFNNIGKFELNHNASGSTTMSGIDHKEPISYYSNVHRYFSHKNGSFQLSHGTISNSGDALRTDVADIVEETVQEFKKAYDVIPGCLYPTNVQAVFDSWKKKTTITWNLPDDYDSRYKEGKFHVYRYEDGTTAPTVVGSVDYNLVLKVEDADMDYNKHYTYKVSFISSNWQPSDGPEPSLTETVEVDTYRAGMFPIALTAVPDETKITLNWSFPAPQTSNGAVFKIYRRNVNDDSWSYLENIGSVSATKQTDHLSAVDESIENFCESYYYLVRTELVDTTFTDTLKRHVSLTGDGTQITSLTCNRGTYSNMIKVRWKVNQVGTKPTHYTLYRRLMSEGEEAYKNIYECDGTASSYYYEDVTAQPGDYYVYYVEGTSQCSSGSTLVTYSSSEDGFAQSKGVLSGRVSYGSGTAVEGAKVILTTDDEEKGQFYSLRVSGLGSRIEWADEVEVPKVFGSDKPFSVQFWLKADSYLRSESENRPIVMDLGGGQRLEYRPDGKLYAVGNGVEAASDIVLTDDTYYNITYRYDGWQNVSVAIVNGEEVSSFGYEQPITMAEKCLTFGAPSGANEVEQFSGIFDDIRVWSKELSDEDILADYDRVLSGSEKDLVAYWPVDEGVYELKKVYDYSKQGGVANEHHASMSEGVYFTRETPEDLSLYGKTDAQGNYVIRGIPFNGDGTNYTVMPMKDSHEFSPLYLSRFISSDALNHSAVDFTDISSFEVSGRILYAGTNIPVDSVQINVDGRQAARNNSIVVTDENGEFTVDVPIGQHYISATKDGHTFLKGGRIPEDPTGLNETTIEFKNPMSGLMFYDNTLVPVAGRVVGGALEGDKPLGLALSKNNIGKAVITLKVPNDLYMINAYEETEGLVSKGYKPVPQNTPLTYPENMVNTGSGYRTGGATENEAKHIVITTDGETGEFAVLLPPLDYKVESVKMENAEADANYKFTQATLPRLNVSHPETVFTDSVARIDGGYRYFDYVASLKLTKHSDPVLSVRQMLGKEELPEGVFGDPTASYKYKDNQGVEQEKDVDLYTLDANHNVTYKYNYPIFGSLGEYNFKLKGYELYTNYEKDETDDTRLSTVPLQDMVVTISNELSASQKVYNAAPENGDDMGKVVNLKDDQLQLDAKGEAVYTWKAGLPNPKYDFTKHLTMSYNNGAGEYNWQGLDGIIFGDLPTGKNFTTVGPTNVMMVLHDPYGDSSSASWESGVVATQTNETVRTTSSEGTFATNIHLGPKIEMEEGFIVSIQTEIEIAADVSAGYTKTDQRDTIDTHTTTIETTRAVSTSSDPDMVGADADIYIGQSENLIYGGALSVGLKGNGVSEPQIEVSDAVTVSTKFDTEFFYTQYDIENKIIPDLIKLRNLLLEPDTDPESITVNNSDSPRFVTSLSKDDPDFGTEGTYKYLPGKLSCIDQVKYYNESIANWENCIRDSEKHKLDCFDDDNKRAKKNLSFGGGVEVTESEAKSIGETKTYTHAYSYLCNFGTDMGGTLNGVGLDFEYEYHNTPVNDYTLNGSTNNVTDTVRTTTFSYTLADSGADDMFTIDVYSAFANHSPVFRTRAGQSSCPYEGEELTKYYEPGEELSAATVQIDQPVLSVAGDNILTGVPTGGKAQFELLLYNQSGIHADTYFELVPVDGANPKGAKLSLPTGDIGNGRTVFVPYSNEPVRMILTLEQGNISETDYEDIKIALKSTCQDDEASIHGAIKSELSLSAHFVPASTPVILAIDKTVVNNLNKADDVTLTVTGFDRNFAGLQRVDVQYMAPGATSWSLLKSYIPNSDVCTDNSQLLLPGNGVIELALNMNSSSWLDGTYQFRAQSSAIYSGKPVTSESEVLTLVKDVNSPQLFGLANPSDGVLNAGDEISMTFNEDIQQNRLTKNNIVVSGVLNGAQVKHDVALSAQNTERAAYSEASINLAKKSFAADMWVRVSSAGDILTHGNGDEKFKVSIDADNHLVVTIGSESYTSTKTIERNTWTFLAFNYEYASGRSLLNARAVTDISTEELFKNTAVADYVGMGSITLGQNFGGAIHELTLWDKARSMDEAQAEKSYTKVPSTPNLIGYWKMDEGDGRQIRDYARNRHLTMPANSWYLNNDNKAVTVSGTDNALKLDISACSVRETEDYAVEMWFKGKKGDQTAASTLFYAGEESVGMGFSQSGELTLTARGSDIEVSKNDYLDNAWHHLALNVLRNGNATVYVDGTPVKTLSASVVPSLAGTYLYIGSRPGRLPFKGTFDEIRLWKASMTGDLLKSQRTQRLTGEECGLVAYYSFEQMSRDNSSGIISSVSSAKDLCTGSLVAKTINESAPLAYSDEAPALKVKPEATNVGYSFVANERSIIITLDEKPVSRLENTTLTFEVSGVRDMNGNESTPVVWTAYVKQNQLVWKDESEVSVEKQVGEPATFEATIVNESGNSENWMLTGLPTWLTASATSGTLKATMQKTITFTIAESVAPGKYEQTIYLTGNNNIAEPLTLNLKVKSEEPDWAVNAGAYAETMNVIGSLQVLNVPSQDEDDIVAAFIGGECRGVARPEYKSRYDGYFVTMDIYSNGKDDNSEDPEPVTFKVFDASTGTIYPVVTTSQTVAFSANDIVGRYDNPLVLNATDMIEQGIELSKGWNWMSLSVRPDQMTVPVVFANAGGKVLSVKGQPGIATYSGSWISTIEAMTNTTMYAVNTDEALTLTVTGHRVNPADMPVTVKNGWNWVGYCGQQVVSVANALAGMNPLNGDVIKAHRGMAYYDGYEWIGTLSMLMPGKGYKIQSAASADRTFTYPTTTIAASRTQSKVTTPLSLGEGLGERSFVPVDYTTYPANMVLIAKVVKDGLPVGGAELGVFAGSECREAAVTDAQGMVYMTVPGDAATKLTFRVVADDELFCAAESVGYETDAVVGTPRAPFVIELGAATGVELVATQSQQTGQVYDLQGRKVKVDDRGRKLRKGVYIVNGRKEVK